MYLRIILFILLPLFGLSQAPQKINFQSILRNSGGEIVSNNGVSLKISILSGSITGNTVYSETHAKTTDASGLISLQIGNGTVFSGVFSAILWGNAAHFIKLEADFNGGSNFVLLGTQELMSVPYALYASKTDTSSLNLANRFSGKLNVTDTSNMLLNYRTGLNNKVNVSDTSNMLDHYLRKSDSIIADLQFQDKLLQSLSNVVDIDGNSYKTVKIGSQVWMSENLKTSRYRNGDLIPIVTDNTTWIGLTTGARCWYDNDSSTYESNYGNLYNSFAATNRRGICPLGWHVPTNQEWETLTYFLGGTGNVGGKMKFSGTTFWSNPNTDANNESGFSALPGGYRTNIDGGGSFSQIGKDFWMVLKDQLNVLHFRNLHYASNSISSPNAFGYWNHFNETSGVSIRCLKDPEIDINQSLNLKVNIADTSDMLNPYLRKAEIPSGTTSGNIQYWNGTTWVNLAPGQNGQTLILVNGIPSWSGAAYPALTTTSVSSITSTSANVGGNISSDGGASVSARGLVYGTSSNPTLSNTVLYKGSGGGAFYGTLTGLTPNNTYYVRSYATNSSGTGYGNEATFQTPPNYVPELITTNLSGVTQTTLTSGGTITNDGGFAIIARGIVYGTTSNPTLSNTVLTLGSGTGSFIGNVTGLTPNIVYYVRAYATNSVGTGYGEEVLFGGNSLILSIKDTTVERGATFCSNVTVTNFTNIIGIQLTLIYNPQKLTYSKVQRFHPSASVIFSNNSFANVVAPDNKSARLNMAFFDDQLKGITVPARNTLFQVCFTAVNADAQDTIKVNNIEIINLSEAVVPNIVNSPVIIIGTGNSLITDINQSLNLKVNIADTSNMLNPYLRKADAIGSVETDPVFNTSIAKGITGIDTAYWNRKLNITDTASMHSTYRNELINKVNILDTTSMLTNYLRKSDAIIADLQNQDKLLQSLLNVIDIDGNSYKTVKIGSQVWMAENLKTTKYRNGNAILTNLNDNDWTTSITGAYSFPENNSANDALYGKLYNGFAVDDNRGLCPTGWHVPTLNEWNSLVNQVGGANNAMINLKISGSTYWLSPNNINGTNSSGFSAFPSGLRHQGGYGYINWDALWWTSSAAGNKLYYAAMRNAVFNDRIFTFPDEKSYGFSVRCLKDAEIEINQSLNLKVNIADTSDMLNPYLRKADAIVSVETDPVFNASVAKGITAIDTSYWNRKTGNTPGNMQYWNGTTWANLAPGLPGQILSTDNTGKPVWLSTLPLISTNSVSDINPNAATCGGNITSDGGSPVTDRGVVWSINPNPTISLSTKTSNGLGIGAFTSSMTGLTSNVVYYVRAYVTNSVGTIYGNEIFFTTTANIPMLTTTSVQSITTNGAISGGNISSDGGSPVTVRGTVWSTSANPTVALSTKTSDGSGLGIFSSAITGLSSNTTYYVRSYASNTAGTGYGNELSFVTITIGNGSSCPGTPTVNDIDGNTYNTVQIGTQCWMRENLRVTKFNDGSEIMLDTSGGINGNVGSTWGNTEKGKRTIYGNDLANVEKYGYLYNWIAVVKGICPSGWVVPGIEDFYTLRNSLGSFVGGKLKNITGWEAPNYGATNESGFSALSGGLRDQNGPFGAINESAYFWTSDESNTPRYVNYVQLSNTSREMALGGLVLVPFGFSVRCIKN